MRKLTRVIGVVLMSVALTATGCVGRDSASGAPSNTVPIATPRSSGPDCGGAEPPARPGGGVYTCTFDDEFTGTTLDTTKWEPHRTAVSGMTTPNRDCYVALPGNISVSYGALHLSARQVDTPFTCDSPRGDFKTDTTAGSVSTRARFSQAFGRFEFRARLPQATVPGVHSALWLNPSENYYGAWPRSGEVDVAEWFSADSSNVYSVLHYGGQRAGVSQKCAMTTPSDWHTYALEWTPTTMRFIYDGVDCWTTGWKPAWPLKAPAPFDRPFNTVMSQVFGGGWNAPTSLTPTVATMDVDWVRVWK